MSCECAPAGWFDRVAAREAGACACELELSQLGDGEAAFGGARPESYLGRGNVTKRPSLDDGGILLVHSGEEQRSAIALEMEAIKHPDIYPERYAQVQADYDARMRALDATPLDLAWKDTKRQLGAIPGAVGNALATVASKLVPKWLPYAAGGVVLLLILSSRRK